MKLKTETSGDRKEIREKMRRADAPRSCVVCRVECHDCRERGASPDLDYSSMVVWDVTSLYLYGGRAGGVQKS